MFGIVAEPLVVLACGLPVKGRWRPIMAIYASMLMAYFIHPFGRWLPLWTMFLMHLSKTGKSDSLKRK